MAALGLALALAAGCAATSRAVDDRGGDAGPDGADAAGDPGAGDPADGDPNADPAADAPADASHDASTDAPADAPADAFTDAATDVPADAPGDAAADAPGDADAATPCAPWPAPQVAGNLDGLDLVEVSGLAASRSHPGVLWAHNDSGDTARVFAIRLPDGAAGRPGAPDGAATTVTVFPLQGTTVSDCEDIAIGPFAGMEGDALFLADTGNNGGKRQVLSVYVFPEPAVLDGAPIGDVRRIDVAYPDGTHDCESFFVDPWTGDLHLVVKEYALATTKVFRLEAAAAAAPPAEGTVHPLALVAEFPFREATAADLSPDGRMLAVRGYFDGRLFRREPGQSVAGMLASPPCVLPSFLEEPYTEPQGEALAFDASGGGFYTVSEWVIFPQDIHYTALPDSLDPPR